MNFYKQYMGAHDGYLSLEDMDIKLVRIYDRNSAILIWVDHVTAYYRVFLSEEKLLEEAVFFIERRGKLHDDLFLFRGFDKYTGFHLDAELKKKREELLQEHRLNDVLAIADGLPNDPF